MAMVAALTAELYPQAREVRRACQRTSTGLTDVIATVQVELFQSRQVWGAGECFGPHCRDAVVIEVELG